MSSAFVEYARAKRALFIALILLGIFFLLALILRLSLHDRAHMEADIVDSPTAHVTRTTLADGSIRTVVDDPARQTHAVIVRSPKGAVDLDATQPPGAKRNRHADFVMGSTNFEQSVEGGKLHTKMHYVPERPRYDLGVLFLLSMPIGLIVASMLGGVLSKENDGHLELAWTKPVSRERYACGAMAVDAAAIVAAQLVCIAVGLLATLLFFVPPFTYGPEFGWWIVLAVGAPLAWYALLTCASASIKRGPGMVIGLGWAAALIVPGVAGALQQAKDVNAIAAWFYAIFHGISYVDPLAYLAFHGNATTMMSLHASVAVLWALVVGYIALAVAQWRRVEA